MKQEYDFSRAERGRFRVAASIKLPIAGGEKTWEGPDGKLGRFVAAETCKTLNAYREQPNLVTRDANQEYDTARGGYAHRQLYELVQNGADALIHPGTGQSILIRLTDRFLYCADDGRPIDTEGVTALMFAHMSTKRGTNQIGRFGMGFKSVLRVTDAPEFFSRSGAIRFDRARATEHIRRSVPAAEQVERYPTLPLPEAIDPNREATCDDDLRELMGWATNIIRLPLKGNAFDDLATQINEFPPEFLLFVPHVRYLSMEAGSKSREFTLEHDDDGFKLNAGDGSSRWRLWKTTHTLSAVARADSRTLDDTGDVKIVWAAPLERRTDLRRFWAFFPTQTASLLAGILNAPWKTNEDRQNLLPGPYNDELIDATARMVADALPSLATPIDPARHLDALPRRDDPEDGTHSKRLRQSLMSALHGRAIVPDQDGQWRAIDEVHYAPEELTKEPLDQWRSYEHRPRNWAHHTALPRNRLGKLNSLSSWQMGVQREPVVAWLAALKDGWPAEGSVEASKAAIRVAALLPETARTTPMSLGSIILTQSGDWRIPDPEAIFLPVSEDDHGGHLVHYEIVSDDQAARDLRALGLRQISAAPAFALFAKSLPRREDSADDPWWREFWRRARSTGVEDAASTLRGKEHRLRLYTIAGEWRPVDSVLLPGEIVPADGTRDANVAVDGSFHRAHVDLLRRVGVCVSDQPSERDLSNEPWFEGFRDECRRAYRKRDLPRTPHEYRLEFRATSGTGPLQVLPFLSDEGRSRYVDALLSADSSYQDWQMGHRTRPKVYPDVRFRSPVLKMIAEHGRIRCAGKFVKFRDAIGESPRNPLALRVLLDHRKADRIRHAFTLAEPRFETIGEEDPIPLRDVWPGAPPSWWVYDLVRCQRIVGDDDSERSCVREDSNVLLVGTGSSVDDLRLVANELGADIDERDLLQIARFVPPDEIKRRRAHVREQVTDAAKLLCAVGEIVLRQHLPSSLVNALEARGSNLAGIEVAEAAIATFHTSALYEFRGALADLAPPVRWRGSQPAVDFVQSLGFAPEWAGERKVRRAPFVEVEGPLSLPSLHLYQQRIVDRVTDLLRSGGNGAARRGMISLPTGAGKTRVTVQAIVQAIRDGIYSGDVLWVADRDELCEQAVEAWRQVWSGVGAEATPLRITRLWGGQPAPVATSGLHVVVGTIQTLLARLSANDPAYRFIGEVGLVVFDEAHRSIAPSYTSVMEDIGLTRWQRPHEPFLLGLTATPYRGHDESETDRLVRRYSRRRLDGGAFASDDPVAVVQELQTMSVLAQADHETIDGGNYSLSVAEVAEMEDSMPRPAWLPRGVEERIARDTGRTLGIVDAYERHVHSRNPEWPTLIFATSVEHAQTVAGLLNMRGVKARAVSGGTDRAVRRSVVDEFRSGKLTVLVNYGVFREGFDAPRTRAIVVARPVYSPNLYFQMIGRGLRGPKNGGSDRCLIINVRDNIDNFDRKLAFTDLDWLWASDQ